MSSVLYNMSYEMLFTLLVPLQPVVFAFKLVQPLCH